MRRPVLGILVTVLVGGCAALAAPPAERVELTVFAAASLTGALEEIETAYERAKPGTTIALSTDSSAALATQIEQGAPADLFLSADTENPQRLIDGGLATGSAVRFGGNALAIIVPSGNPARLRMPADLAQPGVRVIAAGDEVPITRYAADLVRNLTDLAGYPATFASDYASNVVSKEDNVRAVVAKIELGEGDAGIVYATDAAAAEVETIEVPDGANVTAAYAGVIVAASTRQDEAEAFLDWLVGPEGQAILGRFGFVRPAP